MRFALPLSTLALAVALTALVVPRPADTASGSAQIVALRAAANPSDERALRSAGAELVDARLRLWEVDATSASVLATLRATDAVRFVQPVRSYVVAATGATKADPLSSTEWWRSAIGVEGLTPPGPGVPVTVVDSGVSLTHPEFAGRANTEALNEQEPQPLGGEHGTMVSSLVAAPENGVGIVGVYPQARLRSWDAAKGQGTQLETTEIVNGILAAARAGKGVINLSLGGPRDLAIEYAVEEAVALGSLVVAASGNEGDEGNQLGYPAALPRVVTVGATGRDGQVAAFSSSSVYVDVAAPGADVTVASAIQNAWTTSSGTSFSSPLVAGAAAWIWTVRPELTADQVAEIVRRSASDLGKPGRDAFSGYGMLNVAAALTFPAPIADVQEPNDDVDNVDPAGDRNFAQPSPLTTKTIRKRALSARLDRYEDPSDVYRVWVAARKTLTVVSTTTADTDLALFRPGVPSVSSKFVGEYRLARAQTRGTTERLVFKNGRSGRWAYLVVTPGRSALDATYRLAVTVR